MAGDESERARFGEWAEKARPRMERGIGRYDDDFEDIFQDAMLRIWHWCCDDRFELRTFREFFVFVNYAYGKLRASRRRRKGSMALLAEPPGDGDVEPRDPWAESKFRAAFASCWSALEPREKYVLKRIYVDGADGVTAGNELDLSNKTVSDIKRAAVAKLQRCLRRESIDPSTYVHLFAWLAILAGEVLRHLEDEREDRP